jgi:hypothetical protein
MEAASLLRETGTVSFPLYLNVQDIAECPQIQDKGS